MNHSPKCTAQILLITLSITTAISNAQENINQHEIKNKKIMKHQTPAPDETAKELTNQEKNYAISHLSLTKTGVFNAIKNLSEAQLTFKPSAESWSVEECIKHIAAAEKSLWTMVEESIKNPANPEKRAEIKYTDQQLIKAVEDRSHKSKTFEALDPANSTFKSTAEALDSFNSNRTQLIAFLSNTREDLRNHVSVLPIGTYDAYQFILLISAHSNRHTQQIEEVKANVSYPEK
jgi:uncharacterized damage-inducible protein DinB